jgi:hypothetical protein
MNLLCARALTRLYPKAWRARYGAEFTQLLCDEGRSGVTAFLNVLGAALREHLFPTTHAAGASAAHASVLALARRPSAIFPMIMSLAALLLLGSFLLLASRGVIPLRAPDGDEGLAAHLWQLLMVGQLPVIVRFALRWFFQRPAQTIVILGVQAMLAFASVMPVFVMKL